MTDTSLIKMTRRAALLTLTGAGVAACETADLVKYGEVASDILGSSNGKAGLTQLQASAGIKEALTNGVTAAVNTVGKSGGFLNDRKIKIPLPGFLGDAQDTLSKVGASGILDNLQTQLNRGAEQAAPQAKTIFVNAVSSMSIEDALGIVNGGSTAATDFLQAKTTGNLTSLFSPYMSNALQSTGAIKTLDNVSSRLSSIPFTSGLGSNAKNELVSHGVEKGLDGVFYYVGQEEAAIRANPVKRTSEILRTVFG